MKITEIDYSSKFVRRFKKLPRELKIIATKREEIFRRNCFSPALKTHKLHGALDEHYSFSLTYKHRVLFKFKSKNSVGFLDVGDHEIYK